MLEAGKGGLRLTVYYQYLRFGGSLRFSVEGVWGSVLRAWNSASGLSGVWKVGVYGVDCWVQFCGRSRGVRFGG